VVVDDWTYLNVAPEEECGTSQHTLNVLWAVAMLIVFCIGAPLLAFIMLWKFRRTVNQHVQMVLRFFYDGFKLNRYYWEILILIRKFLIVVFIILFRSNLLYQIYGMTLVVQAALVLHILFHPYISGRQFRLELWSLLAMLITLFASLYVDQIEKGLPATILSACVLVLHVLVVIGFLFFIGRGLMRRFMKKTWAMLRSCWKNHAPSKLQGSKPKLNKILLFFQLFGDASEYDRDMLYANLEKWWHHSPNYKRRRLLQFFYQVSDSTPYQGFELQLKERSKTDASNDNDSVDNESVENYNGKD
jgi:hypothetical protein